jgi:hypothetical protein
MSYDPGNFDATVDTPITVPSAMIGELIIDRSPALYIHQDGDFPLWATCSTSHIAADLVENTSGWGTASRLIDHSSDIPLILTPH